MRAATGKGEGPPPPRRLAWLWGWGLTDEVFGAALGGLARGRPFSEPRMLGLAATAYGAWLSGTLAGAWAGSGALEGWPPLDAALGFMLPALFLSLLLSVLGRTQVPTILMAGVATVAVTLALGATAGLLAGMATGALAGVLAGRAGVGGPVAGGPVAAGPVSGGSVSGGGDAR